MLLLILLFFLSFPPETVAEKPEFRVSGGAVYAFKAGTDEGYWSDDGIIYRESEKSSESLSPFFVRHRRLYAILVSDEAPNLVLALDLRAEGRLVWRLKPERFGLERFEKFISIRGDTLKISGTDKAGNLKTITLDVATGLTIE